MVIFSESYCFRRLSLGNWNLLSSSFGSNLPKLSTSLSDKLSISDFSSKISSTSIPTLSDVLFSTEVIDFSSTISSVGVSLTWLSITISSLSSFSITSSSMICSET